MMNEYSAFFLHGVTDKALDDAENRAMLDVQQRINWCAGVYCAKMLAKDRSIVIKNEDPSDYNYHPLFV